MSEAAKRKTKSARKLTAAELMATPKHMLAWLRSKKPRAIVAKDILCDETCLAATFLKARGHAFILGVHLLPIRWICTTINDLPQDKPIRAFQAIAAIKRAEQSSQPS